MDKLNIWSYWKIFFQILFIIDFGQYLVMLFMLKTLLFIVPDIKYCSIILMEHLK